MDIYEKALEKIIKGCNHNNIRFCPVLGPTGPTGPTGPELASAFATIYNVAGGPFEIPPNTQTVVPLPVTGLTRNITVGTNDLTVNESGIYLVYAMLYGQNITEDAALQLYVTINGVQRPETERSITAINEEFVTPEIMALIELNEGDEVGLSVISIAGLTFGYGTPINSRLLLIKIANL